MIAFLTPFADDGISYAFGYVFAGMNLVAALVTWFFLFETRTLSLENIDLMYRQLEVKAWSSSKWAPPGYITRKERDETYVHHANEKNVDKLVQGDSSAEKSE
jgi:SP family sugar:H+ symporter-like MFS transporter